MQYLLFGMALLVLVLLALRRFSVANTQAMARSLRLGAGATALAGAAVLAVRGQMTYAFPLAMLGSWLIWGQGSFSLPGRGSAHKSPGQTSRVVTETLEMELDHDSGELSGKVLKGLFAGRRIERLKPEELALLWQDCRTSDPSAAQIIEAFLDRMHPDWREDVKRGEEQMSRGPDGRMSEAEAFEILGLSPGAGDEEIRRAHRELMLRLHPDRGGSTYLAAKINEAKDVLLSRPG